MAFQDTLDVRAFGVGELAIGVRDVEQQDTGRQVKRLHTRRWRVHWFGLLSAEHTFDGIEQHESGPPNVREPGAGAHLADVCPQEGEDPAL